MFLVYNMADGYLTTTVTVTVRKLVRNKQTKMRLFGYLSKKVGELTIKHSNLPESYVKKSYEQV